MRTRRIKTTVVQGSPATFLARDLGDGVLVDPEADTSILVIIYNAESGDEDTASYEAEYAVEDVLFEAAQTGDERWCSSDGYNFRADVPGIAFPDAVTFNVDFILKGESDEVVAKVLFEAEAIRARG